MPSDDRRAARARAPGGGGLARDARAGGHRPALTAAGPRHKVYPSAPTTLAVDGCREPAIWTVGSCHGTVPAGVRRRRSAVSQGTPSGQRPPRGPRTAPGTVPAADPPTGQKGARRDRAAGSGPRAPGAGASRGQAAPAARIAGDHAGGRESVASAREVPPGSNRTQLTIGAIAVGLIAVIVVIGLVLNKRQTAPPVTDHPRSTNSTASVSGGVVTVTGVGARPALTIDMYEDGICPACKDFEGQYGQQMMKAVDEGKLTIRYHFVDFLNANSSSKNYSSRAAAAFACVGAVPAADTPKGLFLNFHTAMFSAAVQPVEGSGVGSDRRADRCGGSEGGRSGVGHRLHRLRSGGHPGTDGGHSRRSAAHPGDRVELEYSERSARWKARRDQQHPLADRPAALIGRPRGGPAIRTCSRGVDNVVEQLGAVAQLVAHHTGSVGVRGSSPLSSTLEHDARRRSPAGGGFSHSADAFGARGARAGRVAGRRRGLDCCR